MGIRRPGYGARYVERARELEVYYYHCPSDGKIKGLMSSKSPKQILKFYGTIKRCTCGGIPKVLEVEGMGEISLSIYCDDCKRLLCRSLYDGKHYEKQLVRDWNQGMT